MAAEKKQSDFFLPGTYVAKNTVQQFYLWSVRMRNIYSLLSVTVLSLILTSGCTALTGKTAGSNVDDATITASVKTNLAAEKADTLTRIDVDTNEGIVSLNGVVESAAMKQRAAEIAQRTSGVKNVVNNLQIQTTPG